MNMFTNKYSILLYRVILSIVFILAGIEKIVSPELFAENISNYRLFPNFTINLIAITVPWIEIVVGLLLLFGVTIKDNIKIINSMMVFFIIIILIAVLRGLDIDCGCYGSNSQKVGMIKIFENVILLLFGVIIYKCKDQKYILTIQKVIQ